MFGGATKQHKLSPRAAAAITSSANDVYLSVASIWELQIKIGLGKFKLEGDLEDVVKDERQKNAIQILPVNLSHALNLRILPPQHKDPFDRMIISQAIIENMSLISADPKFSLYPAKLLW